MKNERGYTFCKGRGKIRKGVEVTGSSHSVAIPIRCPHGTKPAAIFHTHPGGTREMSPQDIRTMHQKNLPVCIKAGGKISCFRPKK